VRDGDENAPFCTLPGMVPPQNRALERPRDVAAMIEDVIGCKWSLRILRLIAEGTDRPSAIQRACPGLSAKVMNERLAKIQRFGIAVRAVEGRRPPLRVTYALTPLGRSFAGVLDEIRRLQEQVDADEAAAVRASRPAPHSTPRSRDT